MNTSKNILDLTIISVHFNQNHFINCYFESIIQSYLKPAKVLFMDDGSDLDPYPNVKSYLKQLPNIQYVRNHKHKGFIEVLNEAITLLQTPLFMRLDPDDFIHPSKISVQYNYILKHPNIDILGSNAIYYNDYLKKTVFQTHLPLNHKKIHALFIKGQLPILHSSVMGKTNVLQKFRYNPDAYPSEDYELFARMIKDGVQFGNICSPLLYYRLHQNNISSKNLKLIVNKTFYYRNYIFNKSCSSLHSTQRFAHLFFYRKALLSKKKIIRLLYLGIAILFNPSKLFRRILKD